MEFSQANQELTVDAMKEMCEHIEKRARLPFHKKMISLVGALTYARLALETYCNAKATIEPIDEPLWKYLVTVSCVEDPKKEDEKKEEEWKMSEIQEHKDTAGCEDRFKGSLFSENYRKDRAAYKEIVEAKFNDIITVQKLLNQYGDKKLSDLLKDVQGRYDMAKEMLDTFCKEEDDALRALAKKYTPEELVALTCNTQGTVELAMKFVKGEI